MKDKIANYTRWVLIILLALSVVSGLIFYIFYGTNKPVEVLLNNLDNKYLNQFLNWGGVLLGLTAIIAIISPVYEFIINPQNIKKLLIGLGVAVIIVIIAYSLAGNGVSEVQSVKYGLTPNSSKWVGVGLYTTYFGFGLAVIALLYSSFAKMFK